MLGDSSSSLLATDSGGDAAGVDGHDGVDREGGERGMVGGNRWPRQETVALLKIRSEMDLLFRDSSAKSPLWEEISRKLAELGYHRSAKKCKEKFENVYKYHKRTRETRTGKQDGKNYRFFDQLEAFDGHSNNNSPTAATTQPQPPPPQPPRAATMPVVAPPPPNVVAHVHNITSLPPQNIVTTTSTNLLSIPSLPIPNHPTPNVPKDPFSNHSTSSSTFSDDGLQRPKKKKKRKWKEFFERLMKEVLDKQDELQTKFLTAIERREHERMVREESWRMQEMARINKEREFLAQERSMAAAKDTAVMAFLQKLAGPQNPKRPSTQPPTQLPIQPLTQSSIQPLTQSSIQPPTQPQQPPPLQTAIVELRKADNNGDYLVSPRQQTSSSRWPKVEVEALIQLRTELDSKYQENGPKGPLWEEISAAMKRIGYDRSSKRCKEKWENINKYFKKVKESNKKRRDDAKTCPYFKQLDAIYTDRSGNKNNNMMMMDHMAPLMVTPEQQWHPQQDHQPDQRNLDMVMDDVDSMDDDEEDGDDDELDGGDEYEVVANKPPSSNGASAAT